MNANSGTRMTSFICGKLLTCSPGDTRCQKRTILNGRAASVSRRNKRANSLRKKRSEALMTRHRPAIRNRFHQIGILVAVTALLLFSGATSAAQNSNATDGSTPAGLKPGAPSGSYGLSGFDNINLYNGNLNFRLPLLSIGGRGGAGYTMMLPIEQHWTMDHYGPDQDGFQSDTPNDN